MNDRFVKLAYQAKLFDGTGTVPFEDVAKFAELIVKECGVALSPMLRDMISRGQAYDLIKEHFFGVEE
jgi:hypothetical protein